jgi:hypothetical protein
MLYVGIDDAFEAAWEGTCRELVAPADQSLGEVWFYAMCGGDEVPCGDHGRSAIDSPAQIGKAREEGHVVGVDYPISPGDAGVPLARRRRSRRNMPKRAHKSRKGSKGSKGTGK